MFMHLAWLHIKIITFQAFFIVLTNQRALSRKFSTNAYFMDMFYVAICIFSTITDTYVN